MRGSLHKTSRNKSPHTILDPTGKNHFTRRSLNKTSRNKSAPATLAPLVGAALRGDLYIKHCGANPLSPH